MKGNCINCFYFKMKKGWQACYCKAGQLLDNKGKNRIFKWQTSDKAYNNLLERASQIQVLLEHNCFTSFNEQEKTQA